MSSQFAAAEILQSALGAAVHLPGSDGYRGALGRVFFPAAARRHPLCVVEPRSVADVSTVMRIANESGMSVTVRGGGLSSNCVADDAVMVDLSAHLNSVRPEDERVVVAGGARVGSVLESLAPAGRVVPVGIVGHAGFGLATRGGVGYLTRSMGLTVDHIVEAEVVLPGGDVVRLSDSSVGGEADLWWAIRGCAPAMGVVTSATFRTHQLGSVWVDRTVLELEALATYFTIAPGLPRDTTMGAVLGYSALAPGRPVLFVYTACRGGDPADVDRARRAVDAVATGAGNDAIYRSETSGRYLSGLPEFSIPGAGGAEPEPIRLPEPGDARGSFYGKSVFTGPTLDAEVAEGLADCIRRAPTPACRIDFQHTGGALADVGDSATAFWGRQGEWNVPLNAIWTDESDDECMDWARGTLAVLKPHTIGTYSVEVRPGFPESGAEIEAAYGGNLERLRTIRDTNDPNGVLGRYPL